MRRALKRYFYDNFIDLLYFLLSVLTYLYLGFSAVTFFLYKYVPESFSYIIEVLSEPYLGTLGIYVVVKEIERRRGKKGKFVFGELFAIIWFLFLVSATLLTYFSEEFRLGAMYKTVVANSLAAIIIRIGIMLR